MVELIAELKERREKRDSSLSNAKKFAKEKSLKKYQHKVALGKKILELESQGVKASYLLKLAECDESIAQLEMERDTADSMYDLSRKAVDCYQLDMRLIGEEMDREWHTS